MSEIAILSTQPLVERLGWTLIHFVWQAMVVSVIAAAALRVFRHRSANARYVGLCVGLFCVAVAPVVTFIFLSFDTGRDQSRDVHANRDVRSPNSAASTTQPNSEFVDNRNDIRGQEQIGPFDPDQRVTQPVSNPSSPERSGSTTLPIAEDTTERKQALTPSVFDGWTTATSSIHGRVNSATPWIVTGWITGVMLLSMWHMAGWLLASRLKTRQTKPVAQATQELFDSLKLRMRIRAPVQLLSSAAMSVPIVVGWFTPILLMPVSVLSGLPPEQLKAILAHELAHVRRHDILVNFFQTIVESCLFYHPAVWWLSKQIRIEREYCADDDAAAVCTDREAYAQALVSLADSVVAVPPLAMAASGGSLTRRIERLLGFTSKHEQAARRPSWVVSAVLGLAVILGLIVSTKSDEAEANQAPVKIKSVKQLANQLVAILPDWKLRAVDDQPSVVVDGHRGFRVMLRTTFRDFSELPQQAAQASALRPKGKLRHADWEFVLFPDKPKKTPAVLRSRIKWKKSNSLFHTRDICLGTGQGYVWFTRGTLFMQDYVREKLKLEGGNDRIQLAVDGLSVKDLGEATANSCQHILGKFGDRALPYIEKAIEQSGDEPWRPVGSLSHIHTPRATQILLKLYDSDNEKLQQAAEYALISRPFRKAAKRAYFRLLQKHRYVDPSCEACVEFKWKDSLPLMRDLIAEPRNLSDLRSGIHARRNLEGKPIAKQLLEAEQTLRSLIGRNRDPQREKQIRAARLLLIQSDDSEVANLAGLLLAVFITKGNTKQVHEMGIEILRSRRPSTIEFLKSLEGRIHKDYRPQIKKVLNAVSSSSEIDETRDRNTQDGTRTDPTSRLPRALRSIVMGQDSDAEYALKLIMQGDHAAALKLLEQLGDKDFSKPLSFEVRRVDYQGQSHSETVTVTPQPYQRMLAIFLCLRALEIRQDEAVKYAWLLTSQNVIDSQIRKCLVDMAAKAGSLEETEELLDSVPQERKTLNRAGLLTQQYLRATRFVAAGEFDKVLPMIRGGESKRSSENKETFELKDQICHAIAKQAKLAVPRLIDELDSIGQHTWVVHALGLCGDERAIKPLIEYETRAKTTWVRSDIRLAVARIRAATLKINVDQFSMSIQYVGIESSHSLCVFRIVKRTAYSFRRPRRSTRSMH